MEEDHKTKEIQDEGVEKHSCQIELRDTHLKFVYYNGKQVLRVYTMVHVTSITCIHHGTCHINLVRVIFGFRLGVKDVVRDPTLVV